MFASLISAVPSPKSGKTKGAKKSASAPIPNDYNDDSNDYNGDSNDDRVSDDGLGRITGGGVFTGPPKV